MRRKQSPIILLALVLCISISSSLYLNQIETNSEPNAINLMKQEAENSTPDVKAAKYLVQRLVELLQFTKSF